jgi:hypothetical protein
MLKEAAKRSLWQGVGGYAQGRSPFGAFFRVALNDLCALRLALVAVTLPT